ncbi:MAG: type II toxin-antitoxin system RelE/ParE family toxin [Gemmatimonadales bacterium]
MSGRHPIEWAPTTIRDLDEILEYVVWRESGDAAARLCAKILSRIDKLSAFPRRCRIVPELKEYGIRDYRELIVSPYRIFFRINGRVVGIVGVLDGRRDLEEELLNRALDIEG